jgi:hypothetical protein
MAMRRSMSCSANRRMPGATDAVAGMTAARRENQHLKWMIAEAELPDPGSRAWLDGYFQRPCDVTRLSVTSKLFPLVTAPLD